MRPSRTIVDKTPKKKMGRPRSIGDDAQAPAVSVRLHPNVMAQIERWAINNGKKRSDVVRELVEEAIAGRMKATRRPAKRG